MAWESNLSCSNLFLNHIVTIRNGEQSVSFKVPSLRETRENTAWLFITDFMQEDAVERWKKIFTSATDILHIIRIILSGELSKFTEFYQIRLTLQTALQLIFKDFRYDVTGLFVDEKQPLTLDIWDAVSVNYLRACGFQVEERPYFGPDAQAEREFYEKKRQMQRKIQSIRAASINQNEKSQDRLMSTFVLISYHFPYTFEQMYDMTMMQLNYLQTISSRMIGYENGMAAYSAGHLKKAPDFFLK